jgi:hypothetical protein
VSRVERIQHQDIEQRILELANTRPPATLPFVLRDLAHEALVEGYPREQLIEDFEHARSRLREEERDEQEDAVMDVMDFLHGWSANHMKL